MIKFIHGADFHLDSVFSSLSAEKASLRRKEQRQILERFSDLCRDCDLVFLSGDLFDSAHIYKDTLEALKNCFSVIDASIFIAPGNHDCLFSGSPYLTENWGENVHIFTRNSLECVRLEHPRCCIYGAGFTSMDQPDLLKGFHVENESIPNFMVLHGDLQKDSPCCPVTREEISASGLDYLALGHIHSASVEKAGKTVYAYPGCLMGRGFDECGQKGVLRGEYTEEGCSAEFVPVQSRIYDIIKVNAGDDPLAAVRRALPESCRDDCLKIILTGEADPIDFSALEKALEDSCFSLSIEDRTFPRQSLWAHAGEDSLRGCFLQEMQLRYQNAAGEEQLKIAKAVRLVTALMDGREVSL